MKKGRRQKQTARPLPKSATDEPEELKSNVQGARAGQGQVAADAPMASGPLDRRRTGGARIQRLRPEGCEQWRRAICPSIFHRSMALQCITFDNL